ncbi:hypothetical protein LZA78_02400 [Sinirhodobacter sp. WL0062]|uniref:Uncharacterized protein n=1 Tax=Rhodobacter flavimaris TaxID=2907145 RepID=A0ABS8YRM5_9RHOB|nr:hypothetical protein [Sinirhodobacter sp. WL0062]MCE5972343.1 hypothetical protein [Sinirhodobacter sp. WL0062]
MTISIDFGDFEGFFLDESLGQQTAVQDNPPADGDDIAWEALPLGLRNLVSALDDSAEFGDGSGATNPLQSFASAGRIARSPLNAVSVTSTGVIENVSIAGFDSGGGGTSVLLAVWDSEASFNWAGDLSGLYDSGLRTLVDSDDNGTNNRVFFFSDITYDDGLVTKSYTTEAGLEAGNIIYGIEEGTGDLVMIIYVGETQVSASQIDLTYYMMTFEAIYDPEAGDTLADTDHSIDLTGKIGLVVDDAVGFDFSDAPAGKSLFLLGVQMGSLTADTEDPDDGGSNDLRGLLVTGQTAVVEINTSKVGDTTIGYGNQGINAGEVVVFTYVKGNLDPDYVIPNLTQTTADVAANIEFDMYDPASEGQFDIAQTVSSATQALLLRAYDIDAGVDDFEFFDGSNGFMANRTEVDFLTVSVDLVDGGVVNFDASTATLNAPVTMGRITFTLTTDGVKISGMLAGDTVLFTTDGPHDQVEIEGFSGNFDVGGYKTTTTNEIATDIGGQFNIEDAGISVSVSPTSATLTGLEVDETVGTDRADEANSETANGNTDDDLPKLGVVTSAEKIGTLFSDSVTPDTDGHDSSADIDLYKLVLVDTSGLEPDATATTLATTLSVSAGATGYVAGTASITLVLSGGVVYGMYNNDTNPTDDSANIAFTVELTAADEDGQVKVTLYEPIAHTGASTHDEVIDLVTSNGYLGIQHDLVVYDYDDDFASSSAIKDITPFIDFGDDGPTASVSASGNAVSTFALNLDETEGDEDRYGSGDAVQDDDSGDDEGTISAIGGITPFGQKKTDVSGGLKTLFTVSTDAGQDDPGTTSYKFEFVLTDGGADGVATTLKTSVGGETIVLTLEDLNGDGVMELVGREATSDAVAFVVSIENPTSGTDAQLTFRQMLAFENPTSPSTYDEIASILTAQDNDSVGIKLTVTQTDSEGDSEADSHTRTIVDDANTLFTSDDDGPKLTADALEGEALATQLADIALNLDETTGWLGADDLFNGAETESIQASANGNADDPNPVQQTPVYVLKGDLGSANHIGRLSTDVASGEDPTSDVADLFADIVADYGRDEEGDFSGDGSVKYAYSLLLSSEEPIATNLYATAQGDLAGASLAERRIYLVEDEGVIYGITAGVDGIGDADEFDGVDTTLDEYVAFKIELLDATDPANVRLQVTHYLTIDHGGTEDPAVFDEEIVMTLAVDEDLSLKRTVTIIDGDDDEVSADDSVKIADDTGGFLSFDDTGIAVSVSTTSATLSGLEVDETVGIDRADEANSETANGNTDDDLPKLGVVTSAEKIGTLFSETVTPDTEGHDSAQDSDSYKLVLVDTSGGDPDPTATTLATTLSVSAGATGYVVATAAITLVLSGGVVYGMYNGDTDPTDGSANIAFTVELTATDEDGQVKVTLYEPIAHSGTSTHDEVLDLVTTNGYLGVQRDYTVYDYDGDFASDSAIKDITPFIDFGDDGPTASVSASGNAVSTFALNLDETEGSPDRYGSGDAVQDNDSGADDVLNEPIGGFTPFGQKTTMVSGGLKTLFTVSTDAGQDDPGTTSYKFEFVLTDGGADGVATTLKTSVGGETIVLTLEDLNSDGVMELVGREATSDAVAFVVSIENPTSGTDAQLTFRQMLAFENPTSPSTYDEIASILTAQVNDSVGIKLTVTQTDSEGDSEAANYTRTIVDDANTLFTSDDDGPDIGGDDNDIDDADIKFAASGANTSATVDLEASMGRDFDGESGGVTITDFESTLVYSYPNFTLTLTGDYTDDTMKEVVYYIEDGNAGYGGAEMVYFRMKLDDSDEDPANWTYTWSSEQDPPEPNLEFDFDGFPSGQQIYGVFAPNSVTPNGDALLVVPDGIVLKANGTRDSSASTSLNSSNAEASGTALGISGQSVDNGETMYFFSIDDPVDSITVGATGFDKTSYKNGNTLDFDGFIDRTSAQIEIAQTTPNGSLVDMTIAAYNMTSNDAPANSKTFLQDPLGAAHTTVQITSVKIYDGEPMEDDSNLVATATISGDGSTDSFVVETAYSGIYTGNVIDNGDKTVEVTDLLDDYTVEVGTVSYADTFGVTNTDDEGDSFDIGGVNFLEAQFTPDKQLDWEITITDFDGDTDSVEITTGIDGTDPTDTLVVI